MDPLFLSRVQFGDTAAFHILWPLMSIGLALYLFVMETMWLYTKDESYYRQCRFWLKIFVLTFAIGVASGFPLSFQFGTNWAAFSKAAGSFFGNILGFETTIAFTLETASLGILVFGWHKVPKLAHLGANFGVLLGSSLSGFWIMVANTWMQIPRGVEFIDGKFIVTNYAAAIFNPAALIAFGHMWVACIESTLFMVAGIAAWMLLRLTKKHAAAQKETVKRFYLQTLLYSLALAVAIVPLQVVLGDASGYSVAQNQPEKLASVELHWHTNTDGQGAPWALIAWPNETFTDNAFSIEIPNALSMLTTRTLTGSVPGLSDMPAENRPTKVESIIVFYSFRIMIAIGFYLCALVLLSVWYWKKGYITLAHVSKHRFFLWLWVSAIPLGFIATEAGWMVREIGRQPWVVYHTMRTAEGLSSHLESSVISVTIVAITAIYATLMVLFIYYTRKIAIDGPDLSSTLP